MNGKDGFHNYRRFKSPTPPNNVTECDFVGIEDFDESSDIDAIVTIRSLTPSSPVEQRTFIISSPESPSCSSVLLLTSSYPSSPLFSEDQESIATEEDSPIISSYSSPVAKKLLKGSEWLQSNAAQIVHVDKSLETAHRCGEEILVKRRKTVKGGLAESFENVLNRRNSDSNERFDVFSLTLTDLLNGPCVFLCRDNPNFQLTDGDKLGVVISYKLVKEMSIRIGQVIRFKLPWRTLRVESLNTTFIMSPLITEVSSFETSIRPRYIYRWHCSCLDDPASENPSLCCDGRFVHSDTDVLSSECITG